MDENLRDYERLVAQGAGLRGTALAIHRRRVARLRNAILEAVRISASTRAYKWEPHGTWSAARMLGRAEVVRISGMTRTAVARLVAEHDQEKCEVCRRGPRDPQAPHRVYLFHFPALAAYKVGLTHCRSDRRLSEHRAAGGVLVEIVEVPDAASAFRLERAVLNATAHRRLTYGPAEFPRGGGHECWADDFRVSLAALLGHG